MVPDTITHLTTLSLLKIPDLDTGHRDFFLVIRAR
jgi:hypothetical protein